MHHGVTHRGDAFEHLEAFADFVPNRTPVVMDGLFSMADREKAERCHAVAKRQQHKFTAPYADHQKEVIQSAQDRFTEGEAHDRGSHAGGLIQGICGQQVLTRHQQGDG